MYVLNIIYDMQNCRSINHIPHSQSQQPPQVCILWEKGALQANAFITVKADASFYLNCHNPSPSPSQMSKVKSRKDLEWLYSAVPPTTNTNFSQQPDIQLSSTFHSRLTWPRLNDFRTIQEPCPPQIQLLTWRTG